MDWACRQCRTIYTVCHHIVVAGLIDAMFWDVIALLDRYLRIGIKRKRNQAEGSLTAPTLRPDFYGLVRDAMLLKGEEKGAGGTMDAAVADLVDKMKGWSHCYHRQVISMQCPCQGLQLLIR